MVNEIIWYPRVSYSNGSFGLDFKVPREYREWIRAITPEFKEGFGKKARQIYEGFDLSQKGFPELKWGDRGLTAIGFDDCSARLTSMENGFDFHNVRNGTCAIALLNILSSYLNAIQILSK